MTRRALVTGGAGFVGSHLVELLADSGWTVLVVDDLSTGKLEYLTDAKRLGKVTAHVMDIRASELVGVTRRFEPEVVFHLAAQAKVAASMTDPAEDAAVNVVGTVNVLHAAHLGGARRVVFATSGGAIYGSSDKLPLSETSPKRPDSPYGVSKLVVDGYFKWYGETYGLEYVQVAPANIYGPRQDPGLEGGVVAIFSEMMLRDERPTIHGDGSQTRDFVFVEDVVDAFARAADKGKGRLINVGSGRETTILELYELLADITGCTRRPLFGESRPGDIYRSVLDPSRAKKTLGWEAWTPLEKGLRLTAESYGG